MECPSPRAAWNAASACCCAPTLGLPREPGRGNARHPPGGRHGRAGTGHRPATPGSLLPAASAPAGASNRQLGLPPACGRRSSSASALYLSWSSAEFFDPDSLPPADTPAHGDADAGLLLPRGGRPRRLGRDAGRSMMTTMAASLGFSPTSGTPTRRPRSPIISRWPFQLTVNVPAALPCCWRWWRCRLHPARRPAPAIVADPRSARPCSPCSRHGDGRSSCARIRRRAMEPPSDVSGCSRSRPSAWLATECPPGPRLRAAIAVSEVVPLATMIQVGIADPERVASPWQWESMYMEALAVAATVAMAMAWMLRRRTRPHPR